MRSLVAKRATRLQHSIFLKNRKLISFIYLNLFTTYIKFIISFLLEATRFRKSICSMSDMSRRMHDYGHDRNTFDP